MDVYKFIVSLAVVLVQNYLFFRRMSWHLSEWVVAADFESKLCDAVIYFHSMLWHTTQITIYLPLSLRLSLSHRNIVSQFECMVRTHRQIQ